MSKLLRPLWPGPALFVLFWLALLAQGSRFLRDPGQFWHTAAGEKILAEGFFDRDPWTFTRGGEKWIPHQWLGEVGMALAHRVGGLDAELVIAVGIVAALYSWLAARFVRTGLHPVFAVGVVLLAGAGASVHFHVRPHLLTMVGMAATMHAAIEFDARRIGLRQLALLVPLYLVWTNTHGGIMGGLTTLALAWGGWVVGKVFGCEKSGEEKPWKALLGVGIVGVACGLTAFATPYGAEIARTWVYINNGMAKLPEIIAEHARLNFADPLAWPLLALAALYLVLLAGTLPGRPRAAWLLPLFWLAQAVLRVRHGALFAPLAVLVMIDIWPHTRYARWLAVKRPDVYLPTNELSKPTFRPILITGVVCVALALALQAANVPAPLLGRGCGKLDPTLWPTELDDAIKRCEPTSPAAGNRTFCDYIYGGYLIGNTPGYKVFVDDRCELFGDDWLVEFVTADEADTASAMARWQERYGRFDFALTQATDRDDGFDAYFRLRPGEWQCEQRTATAAFYRRK